MSGKLAVLDISESGGQIGEKLFTLIDDNQRKELIQYVLANQTDGGFCIVPYSCPSPPDPKAPPSHQLTECCVGDLYFCLESRTVSPSGLLVCAIGFASVGFFQKLEKQ